MKKLKIGDMVEGFAVDIINLKGIVVEVYENNRYGIYWNDGSFRNHRAHQIVLRPYCPVKSGGVRRG